MKELKSIMYKQSKIFILAIFISAALADCTSGGNYTTNQIKPIEQDQIRSHTLVIGESIKIPTMNMAAPNNKFFIKLHNNSDHDFAIKNDLIVNGIAIKNEISTDSKTNTNNCLVIEKHSSCILGIKIPLAFDVTQSALNIEFNYIDTVTNLPISLSKKFDYLKASNSRQSIEYDTSIKQINLDSDSQNTSIAIPFSLSSDFKSIIPQINEQDLSSDAFICTNGKINGIYKQGDSCVLFIDILGTKQKKLKVAFKGVGADGASIITQNTAIDVAYNNFAYVVAFDAPFFFNPLMKNKTITLTNIGFASAENFTIEELLPAKSGILLKNDASSDNCLYLKDNKLLAGKSCHLTYSMDNSIPASHSYASQVFNYTNGPANQVTSGSFSLIQDFQSYLELTNNSFSLTVGDNFEIEAKLASSATDGDSRLTPVFLTENNNFGIDSAHISPNSAIINKSNPVTKFKITPNYPISLPKYNQANFGIVRVDSDGLRIKNPYIYYRMKPSNLSELRSQFSIIADYTGARTYDDPVFIKIGKKLQLEYKFKNSGKYRLNITNINIDPNSDWLISNSTTCRPFVILAPDENCTVILEHSRTENIFRFWQQFTTNLEVTYTDNYGHGEFKKLEKRNFFFCNSFSQSYSYIQTITDNQRYYSPDYYEIASKGNYPSLYFTIAPWSMNITASGPTGPTSNTLEPSKVRAKVINTKNNQRYNLIITGQKNDDDHNLTIPMNNSSLQHKGQLVLYVDPADNLSLPPGTYTGGFDILVQNGTPRVYAETLTFAIKYTK